MGCLLVCLLFAADPDFAPVRAILQKAVKDGTRGASLLLMIDGKVVFREGFGNLKPGDSVRMASTTKPTTATAVMALVDKGKIDLDKAVSSYLPEFKGTPCEAATVRQLLSHTAGISGRYPGGRPAKGTLAAFSKRVAKEGGLSKPGRFSYSGVGIDLAARVCEVASGKPYEEYFKEAVLDPLGMKHTRFTLAAAASSVKAGEGRWVSGGGGLSSTLDDMAAFCRMHQDGGRFAGKRVLSAKAVGQMHQKQSSNPRETGFGKDYGLGFQPFQGDPPPFSRCP